LRYLICIQCPLGCQMQADKQGEEIRVWGHRCPRGDEYARKEVLNPERVLTTTVATNCPEKPRLPVKTRGQIPLEKIRPAMEIINTILLEKTVEIGEVIYPDLLNTGVDLISTSSGGGGIYERESSGR